MNKYLAFKRYIDGIKRRFNDVSNELLSESISPAIITQVTQAIEQLLQQRLDQELLSAMKDANLMEGVIKQISDLDNERTSDNQKQALSTTAVRKSVNRSSSRTKYETDFLDSEDSSEYLTWEYYDVDDGNDRELPLNEDDR